MKKKEPSFLGPIQWVDWTRLKKVWCTRLVWVLLALIPATWIALYREDLVALIDKKADKGKKCLR